MTTVMGPPVLQAYSLRVQLFSPTAHTSNDKPIRNFRVVTSPEITVNQFCEEASRIHEINYGFPLAIKKVQDDQEFDITQDEVLGNIFASSSIIRVVQASRQPGMRDSIPPTSALRFEPSAFRKRGRKDSIGQHGFMHSHKPNKRRKIPEVNPDEPLPSLESESDASLQGHALDSGKNTTFRRHEIFEPRTLRRAPLQIPETPEPALASYSRDPRNSQKDPLESRRFEPLTQGDVQKKDTYACLAHSKSSNTNLKKSSTYHLKRANPQENILPDDTRSPNFLEQSYNPNGSISGRRSENPASSSSSQGSLELSSLQHGIYETENLISEDESTTDLERKDLSSKVESFISHLPDFEPRKGKSSTPSSSGRLTSTTTIEQQLIPDGQTLGNDHNMKLGIDKINSQQDVGGTVKPLRKKAKQKQPSRNGDSIVETDRVGRLVQEKNMNEVSKNRKTGRKSLVAQSIKEKPRKQIETFYEAESESVTIGTEQPSAKAKTEPERTFTKEARFTEGEIFHESRTEKTSSGEVNVSAEQSGEESTQGSSGSLTPHPNLARCPSPILPTSSFSTTVLSPLHNNKSHSAVKYMHIETSSPCQTSTSEVTPSRKCSKAMISSSNRRKVSFLETSKDTSKKTPTQAAPSTSANLEADVLSQSFDSTTDSKHQLQTIVDSVPRMKSFTPILPPKRQLTQPILPPKRKSLEHNLNLTPGSKVASSIKIAPPLKVTPIIPPKKSRSNTKSCSKSELSLTLSASAEIESVSSLTRNQQAIFSVEKKDLSSKTVGEKLQDDKGDLVPDVTKTISKPTMNRKEDSLMSKSISEPQPIGLEDSKGVRQYDPAPGEEEFESQSQNSSRRDSRSPIAFHRTPNLSNPQRSPSLSSDSHSDVVEDGDFEIKHKNSFRPSSRANIANHGVNEKIANPDEPFDYIDKTSDAKFKATPEDNLEVEIVQGETDKENNMICPSKVQVPNSPPRSQRILPPPRKNPIDAEESSKNQVMNSKISVPPDSAVGENQ